MKTLIVKYGLSLCYAMVFISAYFFEEWYWWRWVGFSVLFVMIGLVVFALHTDALVPDTQKEKDSG
jgi:hypothetical protein